MIMLAHLSDGKIWEAARFGVALIVDFQRCVGEYSPVELFKEKSVLSIAVCRMVGP